MSKRQAELSQKGPQPNKGSCAVSACTILNQQVRHQALSIHGETQPDAPPRGDTLSRWRWTRIMWPESWSGMSKKSQQKEKQHWAEEGPKLDSARKLRRIYSIDPEDKEFFEKNLGSWATEVGLYSLQCRAHRERPQGIYPWRRFRTPTRENSWWAVASEIFGKDHKKKNKTVFASLREAHEFSRKRRAETQNKGHEDSTSHENPVHESILVPQAMKNLCAKAAVDKDCEK